MTLINISEDLKFKKSILSKNNIYEKGKNTMLCLIFSLNVSLEAKVLSGCSVLVKSSQGPRWPIFVFSIVFATSRVITLATISSKEPSFHLFFRQQRVSYL